MPNCFLNTAARHWYIQVSVAIGFFIAYARLQHNISFFFSISQLFFQFRLAPNLLMFCIFCYLFPWKDNATHQQHFVADVCPVVSICHCANYHLQPLLILKLSFSPDFRQFARKVRDSSSVLQKRESVECWHY